MCPSSSLPVRGEDDIEFVGIRPQEALSAHAQWNTDRGFSLCLTVARHGHAQTPPPAQPQVVMPDAEKIVLLLRTYAHHAQRRDPDRQLHGAPRHGRARLPRRQHRRAAVAVLLRSRLQGRRPLAVSVIAPQLTEPPGLDQAKGMLRLKGYFPGQPVQINFEMLYQAVDGRWRLFGLSVQPGPPRAAQVRRRRLSTRPVRRRRNSRDGS